MNKKMTVKSEPWDLANISDIKVNQTRKAFELFHAVFSQPKLQ
jgi:hypothetical protein